MLVVGTYNYKLFHHFPVIFGYYNHYNLYTTSSILYLAGYEDLAGDEDYHQVEQYTPLYGHSLSWQDSKEQVPTSYPGTDTHKLSAKLWMPHLASPEDLALLNETSP